MKKIYKFKSMNKERSIYRNIFLSLIVGITLSVIVLSSVLYIFFEDFSINTISALTKDILTQISYSADNLNNLTSTIALQTYYDPSIQSIAYNSPSIYKDSDINSKLAYVRNTSLAVHSVYILNLKKGIVYYSMPYKNTSFSSSIKTFFDNDVLIKIKNIKTYGKLKPIFRIVTEQYDLNVKVNQKMFTYIFFDSSEDTNYMDENILVININQTWLEDQINSINSFPESSIFITNAKGQRILTATKVSEIDETLSKRISDIIIKKPELSGYFPLSYENKKYIVSFVNTIEFDWKFISVIPYNVIEGKLNKIRIFTVIAGISIFALGLLASIFISKKLYKPIMLLFSKAASHQEEKNIFLRHKKQEFLNNLLTGNMKRDMTFLRQTMDKLKIGLNADTIFQLVVFKIDKYKIYTSENSLEDQELYKLALMNIASELFSEHFKNESIDLGGDHIVMILESIQPPASSNINELVKSIICSVGSYFQAYYNYSISAAYGTPDTNIMDISATYETINHSLNYRLVYGYNCIIDSVKEISERTNDFTYNIKLEKQFTDSILLGKLEDIKCFYNEIMGHALTCSYNVINYVILRLAVAISITTEIVRNNSALATNYDFKAFINQVNSMETLEDVKYCFYNLFENLVSKNEDTKNQKHEQLITKALEIINSSYENPGLFIEPIADKLKISSAYLGRLFKNYTCKSVSDYINDIRMKKAMELLKDTNYSVNEISEKSGFPSNGYFYTLFKKKNGITPNQFRQNHEVMIPEIYTYKQDEKS